MASDLCYAIEPLSSLTEPSPKNAPIVAPDADPKVKSQNSELAETSDVEVEKKNNGDFNASDGEEKTYPEGGLKAWLVVVGSICCMMSSFGYMNTLAVFQNYLAEEALPDVSVDTIGWIFGVYTFLTFAGGILVGAIFDVRGPRELLFIGSVGQLTALILLGFCTKYWHFMLSFGVLNGISSSMLFTPSVAVIGHWFRQKRGLATGIAATGGSMGGVIFPIVMSKTLPTLGFAWTTRILALISFILLTIANILVRSRFRDTTFRKELVDFTAFKEILFNLTTLGIFSIEFGLFVPITYITSYAVAHGVSKENAYYLVTVLNIGSIFGRAIPGHFSDIIGRFNTMMLVCIFCLVTTLALWLPAKTESIMFAFAFFFGFGSGSGISLTPVCISQICRIEDYGKRYGAAYLVVSFGTLTGVPLAGAIVNAQNGQYWGLILFTVLCYFLAFFAFMAARILGSDMKVKTKF